MEFDATAFQDKMSWHKRADLIRDRFPKSAKMDWAQVFGEDPTVMGHILNDVFKADLAEPGRPGKRPSIDPSVAAEKFRRLGGDDYTILPFNEALRALRGNKSIRHFARNTGLPKSTLFKILSNEKKADIATIELVAENLGKKPSYFVEYRIGYIVAMISHYLEWAPESSIVQYKKVQGRYESVRP